MSHSVSFMTSDLVIYFTEECVHCVRNEIIEIKRNTTNPFFKLFRPRSKTEPVTILFQLAAVALGNWKYKQETFLMWYNDEIFWTSETDKSQM